MDWVWQQYLDLITLDELLHFLLAEQHEFLMLNYLCKVLLGEELCGLHQVQAVVRLCEITDAQAVGRVQLAFQKITASSLHS